MLAACIHVGKGSATRTRLPHTVPLTACGFHDVSHRPKQRWVHCALARCAAIEKKCFAKAEAMDLPMETRGRGAMLLCVMRAEECVGYALVQRSSLVASVAKLVVMPAHRRQGIGRRLLVHAIEASRAARAQACTLHVDEANAPAAALYTSVGFTVTSRRADYYALGRHALAMQLDLESH